jgi:uncharacterized protein YbjT (DUF2867 family)
MAAKRPSDAERAHFRRIAEANAAEADEAPPRSLAELFERLDALRRTLGRWADPGVAGEDESELEAHVRVRERLRGRGGARTRLG